MAWADFNKEDIAGLTNEILALGVLSIPKLPQYDTDEGRATLALLNEEIARRGFDARNVALELVKQAQANVAAKAALTDAQ